MSRMTSPTVSPRAPSREHPARTRVAQPEGSPRQYDPQLYAPVQNGIEQQARDQSSDVDDCFRKPRSLEMEMQNNQLQEALREVVKQGLAAQHADHVAEAVKNAPSKDDDPPRGNNRFASKFTSEEMGQEAGGAQQNGQTPEKIWQDFTL